MTAPHRPTAGLLLPSTLCAALLAGLALSCGAASATRSMFGGRLPFHVTIAPDANDNSAVAVDLVVVYDARLVEPLLKLSASAWFAQKRQFLKDHPSQVEVHGWEWVPGQEVGDPSIAYRAGARKLVLFVDYGTEGEHRAALQPQQPFNLVLGNADFAVEAAQ